MKDLKVDLVRSIHLSAVGGSAFSFLFKPYCTTMFELDLRVCVKGSRRKIRR